MHPLEQLADRLDGEQAQQEHSMAMVDVAARICDVLAVSVTQRRRCLAAARLHDIGKIGTPPDILTKPSTLTPIERRIIQDHVRVGAELLEALPQTPGVRPCRRRTPRTLRRPRPPPRKSRHQHHLEARIIAVADAWTAMLATRPYRAALTIHQARSELVAGAGTQFDPTIVEALLHLLDQGKVTPLREAA